MHPPIRILLVDDHILFREGLSRLLLAEPGFQIVGNCTSIAEVHRELDGREVDVILLDYDLGNEQGLLLLDELKSAKLKPKVLMVTAGMSDLETLRALEQGASGIFLKHSPPVQLIEAIHAVMTGEIWLDAKAVRSLVSGASRKNERQEAMQSFSAREQLVLRGVFEGLSNKEIAGRLEISESSVKAALQQLFDKTGVRTRSQLVRIALEKHAELWTTEHR